MLRVSGGLERLSGWSSWAGAAASTPSLLRRRSDRGLRLTPGLVPAGDPGSTCLLYATHSPLAGQRGRLPTISAQANCDSDGPSLPPDSLTSSTVRETGRRYPQCWPRLTVSVCTCSGPWLTPSSPSSGARRPQCRPRACCDGCTYLRNAFPQSSGAGRPQRLTVTAAPIFDPHSPMVSPVNGADLWYSFQMLYDVSSPGDNLNPI